MSFLLAFGAVCTAGVGIFFASTPTAGAAITIATVAAVAERWEERRERHRPEEIVPLFWDPPEAEVETEEVSEEPQPDPVS